MTDVSKLIEIDLMPLCPLCDQPLWWYEDKAVIRAHEVCALAHESCAWDAADDIEAMEGDG